MALGNLASVTYAKNFKGNIHVSTLGNHITLTYKK